MRGSEQSEQGSVAPVARILGGYTEIIAAIQFGLWCSCTAMNQFAAKRYAQELSIRYVSGPRNQKFLPFQQVLIPRNRPN